MNFCGPIAIAAVVGLGVAMIAYGPLDPDESQHLHVAWLIGQGRVPYADFWEHHTPLLHYALAPLTGWFGDDVRALYFAGRAIMGVVSAATLGFVSLLGRRLGPGVGAAAPLLLAVQLRYLQHSTQVRPDSPALMTWLATAWLLVGWRERDGAWRLLTTGLGLGLTATLTPKTAIVAVGVVIVIMLAPSPAPFSTPLVRRLALLAAGTAVPLAILVGWLAHTGGARAVQAFWDDVVIGNLRFPDHVKQTPFELEGAGFIALAIIGIGLAARSKRWSVLRHPVHGVLLVPAAVNVAVLAWPWTPAVYSYAWLPVLAVAAVYGGVAFEAIRTRARGGSGMRWRLVVALAVVAALVGPAVGIGAVLVLRGHENAALWEQLRQELAYACVGEAVLDSRPLAVTRPTAFRYPSLVRGLRNRITAGEIPAETLIADLRQSRAPVGVFDSRLEQLGEPITSTIARSYVRMPDDVLVAGVSLSVPGGTGEREIELTRTGLHDVRVSPDVHARIDAVAATSSRMPLTAGRHRVSWSGGPGVVEVTIAPCADRGAGSSARVQE